MSRSSWKIPYFTLIKNKQLAKQNILFYFYEGYRYKVHNGLKFLNFLIKPKNLGFRIGEFIVTKKIAFHPAQKRSNIKKQTAEDKKKKEALKVQKEKKNE